MDTAVARALQGGELMGRTIALWCAAMFEMRMVRPEHVAEYARALREIVEKHSIGHAQRPSRWISG